MRDLQLDNCRGLLMIYIICFGHAMYWLEDGVEPYLSLTLCAIPAVFFIAGAAVQVTKTKRGLGATIYNRAKRIVAPFYIYALVMLAMGVVATLTLKGGDHFRLLPFDVSAYQWKDILPIILCSDIPHYPFMAHLWFVPLYFILSSTFCLQVRLIQHVNKHVYMAACILLFVAAQAFTDLMLLRELLCYNIFLVAGYLYYKRLKSNTLMIIAAVGAVLLLANSFVLGGHFCPMQEHKFPPDWVYVTYNVFAVSVFCLFFRYVTLPHSSILKIWNERGYTIYLYHSLVLWIVYVIHQVGYLNFQSLLLRTVIDITLVFLMSTALSFITYPFEKMLMRKLHLTKS